MSKKQALNLAKKLARKHDNDFVVWFDDDYDVYRVNSLETYNMDCNRTIFEQDVCYVVFPDSVEAY